MSANFAIEARNSNGDLYLELSGDFDGNSAWEVINKIKADYTGNGRILINTEKVGVFNAFGKDVFEKLLNPGIIPRSKVVFQGAKGVELYPAKIKKENNIESNCQCDGKCKNCACSK
ncbi:MAG: hypothetical protein JRD05_09130 [Deltaproteobacteria bacterium]|nr:hypothetical protein [Deltaproteobacteria bacterium]